MPAARRALPLALLVLAACGGPMARVAGTYSLDARAFVDDLPAGMKEQAGAEQVKKLLDVVRGQMTLGADGAASVEMRMPFGSQAMRGSWTVEGDAVAITMRGENGEQDTKRGTYADGVITMQNDVPGGAAMRLVWRRP